MPKELTFVLGLVESLLRGKKQFLCTKEVGLTLIKLNEGTTKENLYAKQFY